MGIQAIKGVEVGDGFRTAARRGSAAHDELVLEDGTIERLTDRAGGIEGGMSTGGVLRVRAAMKPISTVPRALRTIDVATGEPASAHHQRSDVCAVPAAGRRRGGDGRARARRRGRREVRRRLDRRDAAQPRRLPRRDPGRAPHPDRRARAVTARTIAVIGPMGAGKTSVGRRLAKHLNRRFVDTDAVIAVEHGPIPHLFESVG